MLTLPIGAQSDCSPLMPIRRRLRFTSEGPRPRTRGRGRRQIRSRSSVLRSQARPERQAYLPASTRRLTGRPHDATAQAHPISVACCPVVSTHANLRTQKLNLKRHTRCLMNHTISQPQSTIDKSTSRPRPGLVGVQKTRTPHPAPRTVHDDRNRTHTCRRESRVHAGKASASALSLPAVILVHSVLQYSTSARGQNRRQRRHHRARPILNTQSRLLNLNLNLNLTLEVRPEQQQPWGAICNNTRSRALRESPDSWSLSLRVHIIGCYSSEPVSVEVQARSHPTPHIPHHRTLQPRPWPWPCRHTTQQYIRSEPTTSVSSLSSSPHPTPHTQEPLANTQHSISPLNP
ncbi:hypothetical protein L226DRAFT_111376 [Lentinus tigrinus ALCF2SS1-7]|uniref:Uncharacterized protein n=1 Tax=Lentinus tigrinus ALCF2SS1-6 TaxID=1328759 RepID=A0A5C2S1B4_9APHY|nr:hypothetical protein L227DRAFT_235312 [Lentinus tigrinus ALCF2SS1-6]RPD73070.1 hypothetical protein L226DRAFT_111376 [Lentinus tigrinus ALCF2SS1-7]